MGFLLHLGWLNLHFSKAVGKEHSRKGSIRKWFCAPVTSGCVAVSENLQVIVHSMCHFIECIFILCTEVITDNSSKRRAIKTELETDDLCSVTSSRSRAPFSLHITPWWLELLSNGSRHYLEERWIGLRVVAEVMGTWRHGSEYWITEKGAGRNRVMWITKGIQKDRRWSRSGFWVGRIKWDLGRLPRCLPCWRGRAWQLEGISSLLLKLQIGLCILFVCHQHWTDWVTDFS